MDGSGAEISSESCLTSGVQRPPSHQPCTHGPCPFWRTTEWSHVGLIYADRLNKFFCSAQLRVGLDIGREPQNVCSAIRPLTVPFVVRHKSRSNSKNAGTAKHSSTLTVIGTNLIYESFRLAECTYWDAGPWSACSVTCGTGLQSRAVNCVKDNTTIKLNPDQCVKVYRLEALLYGS